MFSLLNFKVNIQDRKAAILRRFAARANINLAFTKFNVHYDARRQEAFGLPVHYIDEYLSSHEARARLPGEKEVDAMAAAIIAEDWLAGNGGAG